MIPNFASIIVSGSGKKKELKLHWVDCSRAGHWPLFAEYILPAEWAWWSICFFCAKRSREQENQVLTARLHA